jgi:hypothetical protein
VAELLEVQEGLVVRPGDKLLVRVRPDSLPEAIKRFADHLKERFPEAEVTVVAAEQLAVVRNGG